MPLRNPIEWSLAQARLAMASMGANTVGSAAVPALPAVARITTADLRDALASGWADFLANRTDVMLLCLCYPIIGLLLGRFASGAETLPLLFPLAAGFALLGPLAATGLYEISRRREQGKPADWTNAFAVLRSPSLVSIILLGTILAALFLIWLATADMLYALTLGPARPASALGFLNDVLTTARGHAMILVGIPTGFVFAAIVLAIGVVSFPMLIDRPVGIEVAVLTSLRATAANPVVIGLWGLLVAILLALAAIPLFVGLVIVLPLLGHATWHLYRKLVPA